MVTTPQSTKSFGPLVSALLLAALLLNSGCETSVAPRSGADRHFSLYGVVNPTADSQGVIVFPIENELRALPSEPLDAFLTSTDLQTNESVAWKDSIVVGDEGAVHVYWAPFRATHDHTYRLEVQSAAGDRHSEVLIHVPPQAEVIPGPVYRDVWLMQDVQVTAAVERLNFLQVRYVIRAKLPKRSSVYPVILAGGPLPPIGNQPPLVETEPLEDDSLTVQRLFVPIDYDDKASLLPSSWVIPVNFNDDFREIRKRVATRGNIDAQFGIQLEAVEITFVAANAEWTAPDDQFDAEILIQPGTMSNVTGGFGFVGAGYRITHHYTLPDDVLVQIGFRPLTP
ncbi:MAG: hypothetical protein ACI80V_001734 [Rhodothermales bacterium]|jgi:hypothetical protein